MSNEKLHWWHFTFINGSEIGGAYRGIDKSQGQRITVNDVNRARKCSQVGEGSVMVNAIYMGLWAESEFMSQDN